MKKLRILIVEDEPPTARYIERCCRSVLESNIQSLDVHHTLRDAVDAIFRKPIDLCLLDLNLKGENGYELLQSAVSGSFHTIIISAHTEQAVEAFKYGVLDFIPKPFDEEDFRTAIQRFYNHEEKSDISMKYLTSRHGSTRFVFPVDDVLYFKAADVYVEAYKKDGNVELLSKTMDLLEQMLPPHFFRIHRSCIVDTSQIQSYTRDKDGRCSVTLKNGEVLPLSRRRYKELHLLLNLS